jgi:ABC-2 type transport system ATP-binding protein
VSEPVISVAGLRKSYGDFEAVRGLDLEVQAGEIFAFLGPNGAGKTTTCEILEGYRERTAGEVSVLGQDPQRPDRGWYERIGIVLQQCRMRPELTVRETLDLYAGYYEAPRDVAETIDRVGLGEKADVRTRALSGGQLRRLDVAVALVGDPELLFLDEPTTGFDPSARRKAWDLVEGLRDLGKTVFLTTHYMDEAQRLADRVAIISAGVIVAEGAPDELGRDRAQATRIRFRLSAEHRDELPADLGVRADGDVFEIATEAPVDALNRLTAWALERSIELEALSVNRPSLEDVYLELTAVADGAEN